MLSIWLVQGISQPVFEWQTTLPQAVADFETDPLGNIYVMNAQGQVKKLNDRLDSVGQFNELRSYGRLTAVDASNPLRVILWYQDFGMLVILDRFLNRRSVLDLRQAGILQCTAVAQSFDNRIWVYDDLAGKVMKLEEDGKSAMQSPDFRIWFDDPFRPHRLEDFNRHLYAYDSSRGLLVMDYFCAGGSVRPYKGWRQFQGFGKGLIATDSAALHFLTAEGLLLQSYPLPASLINARKIRFSDMRVWVLDAAGHLHMYIMKNA